LAQIDPRLWSLIQRYAPRLGVDPYAAAAVSLMEGGGRFGEVGDNGTSFGPWQLHVGGALPAGKGAAWANSPAGVLYALQRIASVSRGLHGRQAINNIVSRFERPAAPGPEIAGAISRYSQLRGSHLRSGGGGGVAGSRGGNLALALAALQGVHPVQVTPPNGSMQTVSQALASILGQQSPPSAFQPVQPAPPVSVLSPGGHTTGELSGELAQTRQRLLGGL